MNFFALNNVEIPTAVGPCLKSIIMEAGNTHFYLNLHCRKSGIVFLWQCPPQNSQYHYLLLCCILRRLRCNRTGVEGLVLTQGNRTTSVAFVIGHFYWPFTAWYVTASGRRWLRVSSAVQSYDWIVRDQQQWTPQFPWCTFQANTWLKQKDESLKK